MASYTVSLTLFSGHLTQTPILTLCGPNSNPNPNPITPNQPQTPNPIPNPNRNRNPGPTPITLTLTLTPTLTLALTLALTLTLFLTRYDLRGRPLTLTLNPCPGAPSAQAAFGATTPPFSLHHYLEQAQAEGYLDVLRWCALYSASLSRPGG